MSEMTAEQKLNLLIDLAKSAKEMLEELAEDNDNAGTFIRESNAVGMRTAIRAFENAFTLIGEDI